MVDKSGPVNPNKSKTDCFQVDLQELQMRAQEDPQTRSGAALNWKPDLIKSEVFSL